MSAGITTSPGAGAAITAAGGPGNTARLVAGAKDRLFPLDLFTAALLTFQRSILLAHGTDDLELLFARFANVFIDRHGKHLFLKIFEVDFTPNVFPCPLDLF